MSTPAKVGEWLRNNDGNLTDAYKAVGYNGPPLKIKEGNLTTNRSKIRVAIRGDNGDTSRQFAERLNPPQTKEEQNQNRRQNYKRSALRKQGKNVVIDHKVELDLLSQTVDGMPPKKAQQHIRQLEKSYGHLGNRPGNRQIIGAHANEIKRQQSKAVQQALGNMPNASPLKDILTNRQYMQNLAKASPLLAKYAASMLGVLPEVIEIADNYTDGAVSEGINNSINTAVDFVKDNAKKTANNANGIVKQFIDAYADKLPGNTNGFDFSG